ncbi:Peroxisomal multifunctional enzyme type 2 [Paramyrothecium foliicola]|nr:Peroxisomal multifunctional enzyme type 2 [Paramyrothecium foliicola]
MVSSTPLRFDGRVAIVTGSGRGLGREYALLLARLGASVVINSITPSSTQTTVDDIKKAGGNAIPCVGDVSDNEVAKAIVEKTIQTYGRIDIIINNAGISESLTIEEVTHDLFWKMLNVHIGGAFNITKAAWPYMKKQKFGRVVMMLSSMMFGAPTHVSYGTAKMGMLGLARALATDGKQHNILVNSVCPSGLTDLAEKHILDKGILDLMRTYTPAVENAPPVLWLAHEESTVNGENFNFAGRLMGRIFIAETAGYLGPRDAEWTIETVRENWDKVMDLNKYDLLTDVETLSLRLFGRASGGECANLSAEDMSNAF